MTAITSQEELNIMLTVVQTINSYLSDYVLVILLILVGLWYTDPQRKKA